jgi:biopolymer transport protein ExbD
MHQLRVIRYRRLPDAPKLVLSHWGSLLFLLCGLLVSAAPFSYYPELALRLPSATATSVCTMREGQFITISFDAQRRLYISTEEVIQALMLERVAARHGFCLTSRQLWKAAYLPYVGLPITQLSHYLGLTAQQRWAIALPGIPTSATNNELLEYIQAFQDLVQQYNRNGYVDLRIDAQTSCTDVRALFHLLQFQHINRYNLILESAKPAYTDLVAKPIPAE